jgi:hypothetical protein
VNRDQLADLRVVVRRAYLRARHVLEEAEVAAEGCHDYHQPPTFNEYTDTCAACDLKAFLRMFWEQERHTMRALEYEKHRCPPAEEPPPR